MATLMDDHEWHWTGLESLNLGLVLGSYDNDFGLAPFLIGGSGAYNYLTRVSGVFALGVTATLTVVGPLESGGSTEFSSNLLVNFIGGVEADFVVVDTPKVAFTIGVGARVLGVSVLTLEPVDPLNDSDAMYWWPIGVTLPLRVFSSDRVIFLEVFYGKHFGIGSSFGSAPAHVTVFEVTFGFAFTLD